MNSDKKKPAIRVKLADVSESLTEKLGRELEGQATDASRPVAGWTDPYRASGAKHS